MKKLINKLLKMRKTFYVWVNNQPCVTVSANGLI